MEYESERRGYDDEQRGYDRERSRSPRGDRAGEGDQRARSASPNGRDRMDTRDSATESRAQDEEESARNPGTNLFVTGIHPRLSEEEVSRLFEKYGDVEKCNIMRDPHTRESRGFGFVKMMAPEQADAAKEGLQGEVFEGRTLSIEKARRARPRTPTPGKYYGPPKRDDVRSFRGGGRFGGGDRYEERRGGGFRRDDFGSRGSRYGDRYGDRYTERHGDRYSDRGDRGDRYDRYEERNYGRRDRDEHGPRGVDRYASGNREERYNREERRGANYYDREEGRGAAYGDSNKDNREGYGNRNYEA